MTASNLISEIPRELAQRAALARPLRVFRPPVPFGPVPVVMAWHERSSRNGAHIWLRQTVKRLLAPLARPPLA